MLYTVITLKVKIKADKILNSITRTNLTKICFSEFFFQIQNKEIFEENLEHFVDAKLY